MYESMRIGLAASVGKIYRCPLCDWFRVRTDKDTVIFHPLYGKIPQKICEELDIQQHECEKYMTTLMYVRAHVAPKRMR